MSDILIVDDDYPITRVLMYLLTENGYQCRVAHNGVEALEEIGKHKPDLMILDLQMPRMDGLSVCRRIRSSEDYRDLYVIVLTARGGDQDTENARQAGANECIIKPFSPRELLDRVKAALETVETR